MKLFVIHFEETVISNFYGMLKAKTPEAIAKSKEAMDESLQEVRSTIDSCF
jgi:hypothetical protein